MKSIVVGVFLALASSTTDAASEFKPFGVEAGLPVSTYGGSDNDFGQWIKAPDPHPDFGVNILVQSTISSGVCLIRAESSQYDSPVTRDKTGGRIREFFEKIKAQLDSRYGESEFSETFSFFDPGDKWLAQLAKGERYYEATWSSIPSKDGGIGLEEILLQVDAVSGEWFSQSFTTGEVVSNGNPYLSLQFKFSNFKKCKEEFDNSELETMNEDASKF